MDFNWYALRTKSRHEQKVKERLVQKSFEIFYPQLEVWSKRKDRKKKLLSSLFPGYLFVSCSLTKETWLEIVKTYGVVDILKIANKPTPIVAEQILSIRKVVESDLPVRPHPFLKFGDKVVVIGGPLKGAIGIYEAYDYKKGMLIISIDILNRSIEVDIDSEFIEAF